MNSGNPFQSQNPKIEGNERLRVPQKEAHARLVEFIKEESGEREVGIVLPVGCGKSGCIALAPFAFQSKRTLVVAPGLEIAGNLLKDFDPTTDELFYSKCSVLESAPYPEPVEIRGTTTNRGDLDEAHVVITNIQQLQGEQNRWLDTLPTDYFDLILIDEAHHNVASSWEILKQKFPAAQVVNYSATPLRADGQLMSGRIIYSYPVSEAIKSGYVKRLKAIALNPTTLKYVRKEEGGTEVEVSLDEVRRLGETDAKFRRSIVTSPETLNTIVDASIRELNKLRKESDNQNLKIIAAALNYDHCIQIKAAYSTKGMRVDYVHSKEDGEANKRVLKKLKNNELDVIIQVRKLGEGFDHPLLAVAAVFSIFSNLSPFVQFVGRIMRVIKQNDPTSMVNRGTVIFHAGANIASRWEDFQSFSGADQEYFDQLLPLENLDFSSSEEISIEPVSTRMDEASGFVVHKQTTIVMEEIPLLQDDIEAQRAFEILRAKGMTAEEYKKALELKPIETTKAKVRQAKRAGLDEKVKTAAARLLKERGINPMGLDLDKNHINRTNGVILKMAIDRRIGETVGRKSGERSEYTKEELDKIESVFESLVEEAAKTILNGST